MCIVWIYNYEYGIYNYAKINKNNSTGENKVKIKVNLL